MALAPNPPSKTAYVQGGKKVSSLGVFEHWDSDGTREYSRNKDPRNGKGIELLYFRWQGKRPVRPAGEKAAPVGQAIGRCRVSSAGGDRPAMTGHRRRWPVLPCAKAHWSYCETRTRYAVTCVSISRSRSSP